jgi:spore maturation protein CgeB
MNILQIGPDGGTSKHRQQALERLGHKVDVIDPLNIFGLRTLIAILIWKFGGCGLETVTYLYMRARMKGKRYDFCFVTHGETISPALVRFLKRRCNAVACYNGDNPFVARDGKKWRIVLKALPYYDSFCTPRVSTIEAAIAHGAKHVVRFIQPADCVVHRPREFSPDDQEKYSSDVAFVGTWMPERSAFVADLLKAGVPVKIFGARWQKAPEYDLLKSAIVIDGFLGDEDYVRAIQYAKISLGMVSMGNADQHTHRSAEIPAIGSLLCAMRTEQHLDMYEEGVEAVFWNDAAECARVCLHLLANPTKIVEISRAGYEKVHKRGYFNEQLLDTIIEETLTSVEFGRESVR